MLSIPFQQTARYVKYHRKEITRDEKKIIDGAQITKSGKKLLIDSNMLKDIRSFSDRAFSLIRVSDKQVVFEYYGGEFLVYDKGGRLDKGEFCDMEKMDKRRTRMWNLDNGWYYLKLWVR